MERKQEGNSLGDLRLWAELNAPSAKCDAWPNYKLEIYIFASEELVNLSSGSFHLSFKKILTLQNIKV